MDFSIFLDSRFLNLNVIRATKEVEKFYIQDTPIFAPQKDIDAWLHQLKPGLKELQKTSTTPTLFILPETLFLNFTIDVSRQKNTWNAHQKICRILEKQFGISTNKAIIKYHWTSQSDLQSQYWVSLMPIKYWKIVRACLSVFPQTHQIVCIPPFWGQALYFTQEAKKYKSCLGIFLNKHLNRFFAFNQQKTGIRLSTSKFLDIHKQSFLAQEQTEIWQEVKITQRYFSSSIDLTKDVEKTFIYCPQELTELGKQLAQSENQKNIECIQNIPTIRSDQPINIDEQALLQGLLNAKSFTLTPFNFNTPTKPTIAKKHLFAYLLLSLWSLLNIQFIYQKQKLDTQYAQQALQHKQGNQRQQILIQQQIEIKTNACTFLQNLEKNFNNFPFKLCFDSISWGQSHYDNLEIQGRCLLDNDIQLAKKTLKTKLNECLPKPIKAKLSLKNESSNLFSFTYKTTHENS